MRIKEEELFPPPWPDLEGELFAWDRSGSEVPPPFKAGGGSEMDTMRRWMRIRRSERKDQGHVGKCPARHILGQT